MAHDALGAIISSDILPPGTDTDGVISVRDVDEVWVTTQPAHVLTAGWTVVPWVRRSRSGPWVPLSGYTYSPTVDISPVDLEAQKLAGTDITPIPVPESDDLYIQIVDVIGPSVLLVISTPRGLGDIHTPEPALSHGSTYMTVAAATALDGIETFAKLNGTTVAAGTLNNWVVTDNRLTFVGGEVTGHQVAGTWSGGHAAIANLTLAFAVNGVVQAASKIGRKCAVNDEGATPILLPTMDYTPGDYVEMFCASNNAGDVTPTRFNYSATESVDS